MSMDISNSTSYQVITVSVSNLILGPVFNSNSGPALCSRPAFDFHTAAGHDPDLYGENASIKIKHKQYYSGTVQLSRSTIKSMTWKRSSSSIPEKSMASRSARKIVDSLFWDSKGVVSTVELVLRAHCKQGKIKESVKAVEPAGHP
ncbi:hypothetical protein EVAR_56046_1 [Eumeta japonica]|uniref:Uncharacterized protein n=1 Tax=Eumeta variegata TaxID=151549 RepID=A0A4C1YB83_EUMVA|nr:hypothetical protein EVAR_56046_1 [Eumeta japonica]